MRCFVAFGSVIAAALRVAACADRDADPGLRVITRDSAGVEIADIQGNPWSAPVWALTDSADVFRIVPDDARPETLFSRIRGTLRLRDGRIAVLDIGRHRVLLFADDGAFLGSVGRQGQGPGELAQPWRLIRASGDSAGAYDLE